MAKYVASDGSSLYGPRFCQMFVEGGIKKLAANGGEPFLWASVVVLFYSRDIRDVEMVRTTGRRGHGRIYFYAARNRCRLVGADTFVACTRSSLPEIDIGERYAYVGVR